MKIYTEEIRGKLVEVTYDESKIKTHCTLCKKSLGDTFNKRKTSYLERGNFCAQCNANIFKIVSENYKTKDNFSGLSL